MNASPPASAVPRTTASPRAQIGPWLTITALCGAAILLLRTEGQRWWCACGHWWPWAGDNWSRHNSQHLLDPYSLTHGSHGLIFFAAFSWLAPFRRWTMAWRLALAVAIETGWEILENSHWVIDRYRHATMALGYQGDTVANSLGDIGCCMIGFLIALCLGVRKALLLVVAMEILLLFWIRDNLSLNVLMLLHPVTAVRTWQMAGHG